MSGALPSRCPLPDPPGRPAALPAVVSALGSAAFSAGLAGHLLEPALAAHGWGGADADAARAQVASASSVAADLHRALTAAAGRLEEHAAIWQRVLTRLDRLRQEQEAQWADAARRLPAEVPAATLEAGGSTAGAAVVTALVRHESDRAAEHRALLTAVAEDAAATAAVLAGAVGALGGTGRRGDPGRVTLALAARLPGWGEEALAGSGARAAGELLSTRHAADLARTAAGWLPYAGAAPFATALLAGLGADGVHDLLGLIGTVAGAGEERPLAQLLATVVGTAAGRAGLPDEVTGPLLDPADPDGAVDTVAVGMGAVLAAGAPAALAAAWGRQLLRREEVQGATAVERTSGTLPDPVVTAVDRIAAAGDPGAAAALLADSGAWSSLLGRPWWGGTGSLAAVVRLAGRADGGAGSARAGLEALGRGLVPGSADAVMVRPDTLGALGAALTDLLAAQVGTVLDLVSAAVVRPGTLPAAVDSAVRGIGVALSAGDPAAVDAAVRAALGAGVPSAAALAGGWTAVRDYGRRVGGALAYAEARDRAVDRDVVRIEYSMATAWVKGPWAKVLAAVTYGAGAVFGEDPPGAPGAGAPPAATADDAVASALAALRPAPRDRADVAAAAVAGLEAAGRLLGRPLPAAYESPSEVLAHAVGLLEPGAGPDELQPADDATDRAREDAVDRAKEHQERQRPGGVSPGR